MSIKNTFHVRFICFNMHIEFEICNLPFPVLSNSTNLFSGQKSRVASISTSFLNSLNVLPARRTSRVTRYPSTSRPEVWVPTTWSACILRRLHLDNHWSKAFRTHVLIRYPMMTTPRACRVADCVHVISVRQHNASGGAYFVSSEHLVIQRF